MNKNGIIVILLLITSMISAEIIIEEDFSGTFPPAGWQTSGGGNWNQGTGNNAGGTSPEAEFYWSPSTTATQRLETAAVNTVGATELELEFKHSINDFNGDYEIRLETSSDGTIWNTVQTFPSATIPATTENIIISNPDVGSATFQLAWTYDGDSYNINYWYVDDVLLEGTLITYDNDLAGMEISGPTIVNGGNTENYDITIKNVGYNSQDSYTVKLMKSNGVELSSILINSTIYPDEVASHTLTWNVPANEPQGTVNIYGTVELEGDENMANDPTSYYPVQVFPPGIIQIDVGDGTENNTRTPVCFEYKNSLTESIIFADELGVEGSFITALTYYNNFSSDLYNKPTQIFVGETTQDNLTNGWIPAGSLTQVFDGIVNYPSGQNEITIEFDTQYYYEGDNLVIMAYRPFDTQSYSSMDYFFHDETLEHIDRSRYQRDNDLILDPYNPPQESFTFEKFANVTVTFFQGEMGNIDGFVQDDSGNPLAGAEVLIEEIQTVTQTNEQGYYYLGNIAIGDYNVTASKFGYSPQTEPVEVQTDITTQLDFELIPLGFVTVSGNVVGSDFPDIGIEGADVIVTGFNNYQVVTDANGDFIIEEVYTNITYDLTITYEGYEDYIGQLEVASSNLDIGIITLSEIALPPGNLIAQQSDDGSYVDLNWNSPGQGGGEFRYDDGFQVAEIGFSEPGANNVFGAVHPYVSIIQEVSWYLTSTYISHSQVKIIIFALDYYSMPDREEVLYLSGFLPNIDDEWNTHALEEDIEAPNGFFVGIITPNQYASIGLDDGIEEPWIFQEETQLSIENWLDEDEDWLDIGDINSIYQKNMMIRALGMNLGGTDRTKNYSNFEMNSSSSRQFEGYNLYRFYDYEQSTPENWTLIANSIADTSFVDTGWNELPNDDYQFAIQSLHTNGIESIPAFSQIISRTTAGSNEAEIPTAEIKLIGNYPNPFNPSTTIFFELSSETQNAAIEIYNLKGQKVKILECINRVDTKATESLSHSIVWNGTDLNSKPVSSGVYFYKLLINDKPIDSKRMILLK